MQWRKQRFVSTRGPAQGSPPHLPMSWTTRWRSQSCVHVGSDHSLHAAKRQSTASQASEQGLPWQSRFLICEPLQSMPWGPSKRACPSLSLPSTGCNCRCSILAELPQAELQLLSADQLDQAQKAVLPQWLLQPPTSLAAWGSQTWPQALGILSTARWR